MAAYEAGYNIIITVMRKQENKPGVMLRNTEYDNLRWSRQHRRQGRLIGSSR